MKIFTATRDKFGYVLLVSQPTVMSKRQRFFGWVAKAWHRLEHLFHQNKSTVNAPPTSVDSGSLPSRALNPTELNRQQVQSSLSSPTSPTNHPISNAPAHLKTTTSTKGSTTTADLLQSQKVASNNPEETAKRKDRVLYALNALSQILKVATAATVAFPHAQAAVGGIGIVVDLAKAKSQNEADRQAIKRNLEEARKRLDLCKNIETPSVEMTNRIVELQKNLIANIDSIDDAINESWWRRLTEGDAQEMMKHYGKLSSILNIFITETIIDVYNRVELLSVITAQINSVIKENSKAITQLRADEKFKQLERATNVAYDAAPKSNLRRSCTPQTREQILLDLMSWATNDTNMMVYWLSGMAGTGKTTIAYTFCNLLQKAGLLCSSFFCSRAVVTSRNTSDVLPSIAFHLASYSQQFAESLFEILQEHNNINIQQKILEKQFHELILRPAKEASLKSGTLKLCVVVYDGLDEADNVEEVGKLVALFLKNAGDLPFKIFISSRCDNFIKSEFENETTTHAALLLHDVEQSLVKADIQLYIREHLEKPPNLVSKSDIDTLVEHSGTLFVHAAVVCSFIEGAKKGEIETHLQAVLNSSSKPIPGTKKKPYKLLDEIYTQILSDAMNDSEDIWNILLVILTTQNPITIPGITSVLGVKKYRVTNVTTSLHAVLTGSDEGDHPVTIFHASFWDYLNDGLRGENFCKLILVPHKDLTIRCLEIMKEALITDNICVVENKEIAKSDVKISKIRNCISEALEYACTSWIHHLMALDEQGLASCEKDTLHFFNTLVLWWIECMAWLGKLEDLVRSLQAIELAQHWSLDLRSAAIDARRCVLQCFDVICDFPLEVYHSAVVWLPKRSRISQWSHWEDWKIICGIAGVWDACESTIVGHKNSVTSVCFSHDGKKIVSGSLDCTIQIWNAETGDEERKLEGHSGSVQSVAISHDGKRVVSGSLDKTVCIWNADTGTEERKLEGHSNWVRSVAISHDGKRVVSGSLDKTVRIWNADTGAEERKLEDLSDQVVSVAISHNGRKITIKYLFGHTQIWTVEADEVETITYSTPDPQPEMKSSLSSCSITYTSQFVWISCTQHSN